MSAEKRDLNIAPTGEKQLTEASKDLDETEVEKSPSIALKAASLIGEELLEEEELELLSVRMKPGRTELKLTELEDIFLLLC